jgi:hypothetical protein
MTAQGRYDMASQVKEVVGQPPNPSRPPFNKGRRYTSLEKGGKRNLRTTWRFAYPGWSGQFQQNLPLLPGLRRGGEVLQAFGAPDSGTVRPFGLTISRLIRQVFVHPLLLTTYLLRRP